MSEAHGDPVIRPVDHFAGTRSHAMPRDRLAAVRKAAQAFREEMLSQRPVAFYRSYDVVKAPYPTKYGLRDATPMLAPFIHILNRLFVVQFHSPAGIKTMLCEPLDRVGNAEAPFYKRLAGPLGGPQGFLPSRIWPSYNEVESVLSSLGLAPDDVDYITYDHLHVQDLRKWLGAPGRAPFFPRAKLLVMRSEWAATKGVLPQHAAWYPPQGLEGVPDERVIQLDGDVVLGEGVALVHTPGHTAGNHSIVVRTDEGLFVTSENGVAVESWAPEHSEIPGVRRWARTSGCEVLLNSNTLESSVDQYISMVQEKEIAGPSKRNPDFPNLAPSSEMTAHALSPGLRPTWHLGEVSFGQPVRPSGERGHEAAAE